MKFEEIKNKLKEKTVGIAGCGGLGSNCAVALARVGVGNLLIVDFDVIEESNLNRQYYFFDQIGKKKSAALKDNIKKINPEANVIAIDKKLDSESILEIFKDCDVIVEAFDKALAKTEAPAKLFINQKLLNDLKNMYGQDIEVFIWIFMKVHQVRI